jgi:hypothetical protein
MLPTIVAGASSRGKLSYGAGGKRIATAIVGVLHAIGDRETCIVCCGATPERSTRRLRLERSEGSGCRGSLSCEGRQKGFREGGSSENFSGTESLANCNVLGELKVSCSHGRSSKQSVSLRASHPAQFPIIHSFNSTDNVCLMLLSSFMVGRGEGG